YFKIKKGSFDEFLRVSVNGVWPYFEKLGSRVIGMWKVITPTGVAGAPPAENKDFDEVYLSTRYASIDHWKASRDGVLHGGNGPDWDKCKAALDRRAALPISSNVIFLKGSMAPGGPYFMPGLDESYEKKPAKSFGGGGLLRMFPVQESDKLQFVVLPAKLDKLKFVGH